MFRSRKQHGLTQHQLYNLYTSVISASSKDAAEQRQLKASFLKIRQELNATSSQDEFAKWAKLRRQHDKLLEQLEKKSTRRLLFHHA